MNRRDGLLGISMIGLCVTAGHGTFFALVGWLTAFTLVMQFLLAAAISWMLKFSHAPDRDPDD